MKRMPAFINKNTVKFIIEGKKVSNEYLLKHCRCKPELLEKWLNESSAVYPLITHAKKLVFCLHVPFAALYMNSCDIKIKSIPTIRNYRTIQNSEAIDDSLLNITIQDMMITRDFLLEARNCMQLPSAKFNDLTPESNDPKVWSERIRQYFSIDINHQFNCSNSREFYLYLRRKIEEKGLFIYCFNGLDVEIIRGIAISDEVMPMIGINVKDRYPAKIFSIIHELVHIYKRQSSFCNEMKSSFETKQEEKFCNAVAGEFLVPSYEIHNLLSNDEVNSIDYILIKSLAQKFKISKDVIIRRLFDLGIISDRQYNEFNEQVKKELDGVANSNGNVNQRKNKRNTSRSMYKSIIVKISSSICKVLYEGYCRAIYDDIDISNYLGLDVNQVKLFLQEVEKWDS